MAAPIALPSGRVQITIVPIPELLPDDPFWQLPRNAQEVTEERQTMGDEWEDRMRRIEQIQAEAARARRGQGT